MYLTSKVSLEVFSNRHGLVITNQSKKILSLNSCVIMTVYVSQMYAYLKSLFIFHT